MERTFQRLLVVGEEPRIRGLLARYLVTEGFRVTTVPEGAAMAARLAHEGADLVILDLTLSGEEGLSLARRACGQQGTPFIVVSARSESAERIAALEAGADDCLSEPFEPRELLARIRAVLRRHHVGARVRSRVEPNHVATFGPYRLDMDAQELTKDGRALSLSAAELALLSIFVEHPNRVLSRNALCDMIKGRESRRSVEA